MFAKLHKLNLTTGAKQLFRQNTLLLILLVVTGHIVKYDDNYY